MKTSCMLVAAMALIASVVNASGTLGSGAAAATSPSKIDSSAGSVMGAPAPANSSSDGSVKPGSLPNTPWTPTGPSGDPDGTPAPAGGFAGGFQTSDDKAHSLMGSGSHGAAVADASTTTAPPKTNSGVLATTSVVTIVSVATAIAAVAW